MQGATPIVDDALLAVDLVHLHNLVLVVDGDVWDDAVVVLNAEVTRVPDNTVFTGRGILEVSDPIEDPGLSVGLMYFNDDTLCVDAQR